MTVHDWIFLGGCVGFVACTATAVVMAWCALTAPAWADPDETPDPESDCLWRELDYYNHPSNRVFDQEAE